MTNTPLPVDFQGQKASLRLVTRHEPGSLADALAVFKAHEVNLTKIQSMPIVGKPYQYAFNIDVEWQNYDSFQTSIEVLRQTSTSVNILGEYKKGMMPG